MAQIVKRKGHAESFDERKIYASVFAACIALRMADAEAELIAENVTKEVTRLLKDVHEIKSESIHKHVTEVLERYSPDASFIYDTHRDIS